MNKKMTYFKRIPSKSTSKVQNAWENYINKGVKSETLLRSEILLSWERSKGFGVNPFQKRVNKNVTSNELIEHQERNEKLLYFADKNLKPLIPFLEESETIITIGDRNGILLKSYGVNEVKREVEKINWLPGADWSEKIAGTNATGTAIYNKKPIQILFTEHFSEGFQDWFSTAAPILNPFTKELMGVLDLSGKWKNINSHTLALITSKANNITKQIEGFLYQEGLSMNPFLMTVLGTLEDGVMIVDGKKDILKMNEIMKSFIPGIGKEQSVNQYPKIERLVDPILSKKRSMVEEEIWMSHKNERFICTAQAIVMDHDHLLGVFVRLRRSIPVIQKTNKGKTMDGHPYKKESEAYTFDHMIGSSSAFVRVVKKAKKAAALSSTLLLNGESGTGKEWFAQSIHNASERANQPFIALNCGAIPRELVASELFGYTQGAFTGARNKGNPGKFELANGGTIFLDEIGDMPLDAQVHLLRVLEERVVTRIGGSKPIPVDVRVIAATHKNLYEAVEKGTFRKDLYFRLRVIHLEIPSLRERAEDIPLFVHHFIRQLSGEFGKTSIDVHPETMDYLQSHAWTGNIRELKNVVEQALFNMEGDLILPCDLPPEVRDRMEESEDSEKNQLILAIRTADKNVSKAAERLGISRATMYRKMKKYGIII
ncbi:sigma-54-dependent Fis family transcriptional regulator [Aliidiomarina quisquiliarum]|uniref:sigma-54-dependent Fis family transcriptional regulator n=1 Tax=Aliidiomarina quisquiliarum TaxID=2938947 RepID=UPI00208E4F31|nr:sigma-54-dependent Fis family transcriptional regulator [Aliidiomarina quisquiliarum]MCO4321592.1 sigma-54-dependent Fis family transcriptional regulator [Aliidiomarina quisquiliarum]